MPILSRRHPPHQQPDNGGICSHPSCFLDGDQRLPPAGSRLTSRPARHGARPYQACDIATFGINWSDLREGGIFGDGAAAVIIRRTEGSAASAILSSKIETLSAGVHHCRIPAGGSRYHPRRGLEQPFDPLTLFHMEGKAMFKLASEALPGFTGERTLSQQCRNSFACPDGPGHAASSFR